MRIALDAGHSLDRNPSGVAVYSSNIIRELTRQSPHDDFLLCYRANRFFRSLRRGLPENCSRALLEEFTVPFFASRVEVFHGLNQRLPGRRFRKAVTTFHDLFVISGEYSTAEYRKRFTAQARNAAQRSDRLIAVSEFTANQAAELLGYPHERITTIPHGVEPVAEFSALELQAFRDREGLSSPFLLHVGAIQTRKNILRLVEAFEGVGGEVRLVLAGSAGYGADRIWDRIQRSPAAARIRHYGYVAADFRAKLYRSAAALAFPSLDEGFGMPALEAMSAGLPVVASNRSALSEVAGEAALLVDPLNVDEIRAGLRRVLEDDALRETLKWAGLERVRRFTWEHAALRTLQLYREL